MFIYIKYKEQMEPAEVVKVRMEISPDRGLGVISESVSRKELGVSGMLFTLDHGAGCTGKFCSCKSMQV